MALKVKVLSTGHGQNEDTEHELHHCQVDDEGGGGGAQVLGHRQSDDGEEVT